MREILFRGRDISRQWHYGVPLMLNEDYVCIAKLNEHNKTVDYKTVGQYTGLTDKNGKKIFEGDIIIFNRKRNLPNTNQTPEVIIYNQRDCAFQRYPYFQSVTKGGAGKLIQTDMMSECEVIGNIHDNPELLKE